jgi:hypothetical protein
MRLATSDYDKAAVLALKHGVSVAGVFRWAFRKAIQQDKLDKL